MPLLLPCPNVPTPALVRPAPPDPPAEPTLAYFPAPPPIAVKLKAVVLDPFVESSLPEVETPPEPPAPIEKE
jgi:hypothetical protein